MFGKEAEDVAISLDEAVIEQGRGVAARIHHGLDGISPNVREFGPEQPGESTVRSATRELRPRCRRE
jgi:hypothetical protein